MDRELAVNEMTRPRTLLVLTVVVALEALALVAATVWLAIEIAVATPESMATAIALAVTCAIVAAGVAWLAVGLARRRHNVRGGVLVWQIMQAAIGIGALQGVFARPDIGWVLLIPAIVGFVLVLTPSVSAALGHTNQRDDA